jgi:hypothetical protein
VSCIVGGKAFTEELMVSPHTTGREDVSKLYYARRSKKLYLRDERLTTTIYATSVCKQARRRKGSVSDIGWNVGVRDL